MRSPPQGAVPSDALVRPPARLVWTFAGMGGLAAVLGPALPATADRLGVSVGTASAAVPALFGGLFVGVVAAGFAAERLTPTTWLRLGAGLAGLGALAAAAGPGLAWWLASAAAIGVGFGITEVTATWTTAHADPSGRWLSWLGAAFALAAIAVPFGVGTAIRATGGVWPAFLVLSGLQTALLLRPPPAVGRGAAAAGSPTAVPASEGAPAMPAPARMVRAAASRRWRPGAVLAVVVVAYVGAETVLSTWAAPLTGRLLGIDAAGATVGATGFWAALAIGRLLGARLLRRVPARTLLVGAVTGGVTGCLAAAVVVDARPGVSLGLLVLTVVVVAPTYSLVLTLAGTGPGAAPRRVARSILLGAAGGILAPLPLSAMRDPGPAIVIAMIGALLACCVVLLLAWSRSER